MRKNTRTMKLVGLLATGAMMMQFGGCLGGLGQQAGIGFARAFGALPAGVLYGLVAPLLGLGGTDAAADGDVQG